MTFPTSLETVLAHQSGDGATVPDHTELHRTIAAVLNALQAKVGADGSAVTSSHDYKIRALAEAIANIDFEVTIADVEGLADELEVIYEALAGKSAVGHTHGLSDVSGLQSQLDTLMQLSFL